jgi:Ca2+-binding RTX toxin-like protein
MSGIISVILNPDEPFSTDYTGDVEHGTSGNDTFHGGPYSFCEMHGGAGNDVYNIMRGGSGTTITDTSGFDVVNIDLDSGESYSIPAGIEELNVDSVWEGWLFVNADFTGGGLDADMVGKAGVTIHGNSLNNVIRGSDLADVVNGNGGNDFVAGLLGADTLNGGAGNDSLFGGDGADVLSGGTENDRLEGGAHNDRLNGGDGADTMDGGTGADTMTGGYGNDTYKVDHAGDKVVEYASSGIDGVETTLKTFDLNGLAAVENLTFASSPVTGPVTGYGNALANKIVNATNNAAYIDAGAGFDVVTSGSGNDTIITGDGNDTADGGSGADNINGGLGADSLNGYYGNDWLNGGDGADRVDGGADHDVLIGGLGQDTLRGGTGNDLLNGGADHDRLEGGAGKDTVQGGTGWDDLYGGADRDTFRFTSLSDSTTANRDVIFDFFSAANRLTVEQVGTTDLVDLSMIDANSTLSGNQAFTWTGTGNFFKSAGDLWVSTSAAGTYVNGDVNGDAVADFQLLLAGVTAVSASDFIL